MSAFGLDTCKTRRTLTVGGKGYEYFSLRAAAEAGLPDVDKLPISLKVLLENLLRNEDERSVSVDDIRAMGSVITAGPTTKEIAFRPARVLMQDFTGVPAVVDLAAMRDAMNEMGGDPEKINPLSPVDLVIDHSVIMDYYGSPDALDKNVHLEYERNTERYSFLRWGQQAFANFRVVPPGTGICHQVNLEYLAQTVWTKDVDGKTLAYPDTVVGTDSHTPMVNALGVLGWGVGGIEAEAAMLGQPISMLIPEVVGVRLTGALREGTTATDLVLTITQTLRKKGVVGKFVEYFGPGLDMLSLADRATISNMAPEYGATCGFFPIDKETIAYLGFTGRDKDRVALVEAYAKEQGLWRDATTPEPVFGDIVEVDLDAILPSMAGPRRPQDKVLLSDAKSAFEKELPGFNGPQTAAGPVAVKGADYTIANGAVVLAAITSCTNTSNPSVLVAAGLVARKAHAKGLTRKPWVKTSLAPGSQVVADYLAAAGLQADFDALGFNIAGFGCTTCIGNSGPLDEPIADAIDENDLTVAAVLSGNRNFEGRVHPQIKANYLASPPLVVAYALAGTMLKDLTTEPIGEDASGQPVYLRDIWPSNAEVQETMHSALTPDMFRSRYSDVFKGDTAWQKMPAGSGNTYAWVDGSTYVKHAPYFEDMPKVPGAQSDIVGARALAVLGDSVTTDHISPAGSIKKDGPAGEYLLSYQVRPQDFNQFGARRGNHEVMIRGTFANIRLKNEMVPGTSGGITRHMPDGATMPIYDAAMKYRDEGVPLIIIGGKEYGTGSSRDWAAKGTLLLGVKAVIVESFERIHRSNLVGMGVLPLQFPEGVTRKSLGLDGSETFDLTGIAAGVLPRMSVTLTIKRADGKTEDVHLHCRVDTLDEAEYFRHGGILPYVLRGLLKEAA